MTSYRPGHEAGARHMNPPEEVDQAFRKAGMLQAQGRLAEAEQAYRQLATASAQREAALQALVDLYLEAGRHADALNTLVALTEAAPERFQYHARLAGLLDALGRTDAAIGHYQRLLERQPGLAAAHFNLALMYKKRKRHAEALAAYQKAIELGIGEVQDVYSNMGVLYSELRDADRAAQMYRRALEIDPDYVPALFNRAGLFEEAGQRQQAIELYQRILAINPGHWDSLARLAHAQRIGRSDDPLIGRLRRAIEDAGDDRLAREGLYFALGKALDDLGRYEEAFAAFSAANELGSLRNPRYDRVVAEQAFAGLIRLFNAEWIRDAATGSRARPIFICGMFRSGSTLVEQILGAHRSVTAGGELDFLPWLAAQRLAPYPQRIASASREELQPLADEYLSRLRELFADRPNITDKRPDNFLHLGLIKALFPDARIVYTRRNPLDNCLSVYFQQLGGKLSYATDLEDIAHYYVQHDRLMKHWTSCFAENIFTVDYDELVRQPEPLLRRLLDFLGLEWDERCLEFSRASSLVKTASVWQVREPLHSRSSGRWCNYQAFLGKIDAILQG